MTKSLGLIALGLLLLTGPGFAVQAHAQGTRNEISSLDMNKAGDDAKAAFAKGDSRFLGVRVIAVNVPGVDTSQMPKSEIHVLQGIGSPQSEDEIDLDKNAEQYCQLYNMTMMGLRKGKENGQ